MAATANLPPRADALSARSLEQVIRDDGLGGFQAVSAAAACLGPLLDALGWRGEQRHLTEALPHVAASFDELDLARVLENLSYTVRSTTAKLSELDSSFLPCLFLAADGALLILLSRDGDQVRVFDSAAGAERKIPAGDRSGTAYLISERDTAEPADGAADEDWFWSRVRRFKSIVYKMLAITAVSNIASLTIPFFIMIVYDTVITARSSETLGFLFFGVLLAIALDFALGAIRSAYVSAMSVRLDNIIGSSAFRQILSLPISMTESAPVGSQIGRLRQFESVRDFFASSLVNTFLNIPFIFIALAAILAIAGPIVWIPVVLCVAFAVLGMLYDGKIRTRMREASSARSTRQNVIVEMVKNYRMLKLAGVEDTWVERLREYSSKAALARFSLDQAAAQMQVISQLFVIFAGTAVLGFATLRVMDGAMTVGALVATFLLSWRVLTPLQSGFLSVMSFENVRLAIEQISRLMHLEPETKTPFRPSLYHKFAGAIEINRVGFRYAPGTELALAGVSLAIKPGEVVAITGGSGAGKSTLLKLIMGLYRPQMGAISIDGLDVRQIDPLELRQSIAYVPQDFTLFHGTIAQNLRLGYPLATDAELARAIVEADLMDFVAGLPHGLDSWLKDTKLQQLSPSVSQKLSLARAYVNPAALVLLDDPGSELDDSGDSALCKKLQQIRGKATTLIATHRPRHMRLADRIIHLERGQVVLSGTPDEVLPKLFPETR